MDLFRLGQPLILIALTILMAIMPIRRREMTILKQNNVVQCHDGNTYAIGGRTTENYVIGVNPFNGSQRLFKPDGHYAGSDKTKDVSKVV